jgi:hypothetical protein
MDGITIGLVATIAVLVTFGLIVRVLMSIRKCKHCNKRFWKWVGNPKKKKIYIEDIFFCEACQTMLRAAHYQELEKSNQSNDDNVIDVVKLEKLSQNTK